MNEDYQQNFSKTSLRNVNKNDFLLLFNWANEKTVRNNSINKNPILLAEHKKWFEKKLKCNTSKIYILMYNEYPVGQVRFDIVKNYAIINYSVDVNHRGRGMGKQLLRLGLNKLKKLIKIEPFIALAKVQEQNLGSVKIFEKLNFSLVSSECINDEVYRIYSLKIK